MKKILITIFIITVILFGVEGVKAAEPFFGDLDVIKCGTAEFPEAIPTVIRAIVNIIKIATPIVLIVMGMIDMLRAVMANDDKKIAEGKDKFIKRLVLGALVFFVIMIVQFMVGVLAPEDESDSIISCINCMVNDANSCN